MRPRKDVDGRLRAVLARLSQALPTPDSRKSGADDGLDADALENATGMLEALCEALSSPARAASPGGATRPDSGALETEHVAGLRGSSRAITIPELLSFVAGSYKQGLLRIRTPEASFLIQVEGGTVTDARCDRLGPGEDVGAVLVALGALSAADLARVVSAVGRRQEALVPALLAEELITAGDAARAAEEQIRILFRRLGGAAKAEFWFYEEVRLLAHPRVRLNVTKLLLDAARLEDEASRRRPAIAADADPPAPEGEALSVDERVEKHALEALLRLLKDGEVGLPLLDSTAYELLGMCWDENTDAQTLKERIDFDLGLSAHLLRVANSSVHAPVVPVTSVQLAIARLGMENIREIVLAIIVRNKMFSVPGQEIAAREVWLRSALRCSFAQAICKKSRSGASRGTTVSLLLDIGQPVVLSARRRLEKQLGGTLSDDAFAALAHKLHPPVGAELVRRWSMPAWLETVIRLQRTPSKCVEHPAEAWLAHLADRMAAWCAEKDEDLARRIAGDPAWLELGLSAADVRAILADAARIERRAAIYR
jgi:HD-like signal output (HDOD) protein